MRWLLLMCWPLLLLLPGLLAAAQLSLLPSDPFRVAQLIGVESGSSTTCEVLAAGTASPGRHWRFTVGSGSNDAAWRYGLRLPLVRPVAKGGLVTMVAQMRTPGPDSGKASLNLFDGDDSVPVANCFVVVEPGSWQDLRMTAVAVVRLAKPLLVIHVGHQAQVIEIAGLRATLTAPGH